jgi:DNA modification methylase
VIFHYAPEGGTFNVLYDELSASSIAKWGRNKKVKAMVDGRITSVSTDEPSPGVPMGDVWSISIIAPKSKERDRGCRFPTQKPVDLIKRVILSTSSVGDVVLDPCAGSGTSLEAARACGRGWIGIDRSEIAIAACERRLGIVASNSGIDTGILLLR